MRCPCSAWPTSLCPAHGPPPSTRPACERSLHSELSELSLSGTFFFSLSSLALTLCHSLPPALYLCLSLCLFFVSLPLSLALALCLSLSLSFSPSLALSVSLCLSLSLSLSLFLSSCAQTTRHVTITPHQPGAGPRGTRERERERQRS